MSFVFALFKGHNREHLLDDAVNLLGDRLELHSLASLLSAALRGFLVRPLACMFFGVVPQGFTFFYRIFGAVQHEFFTPGQLVALKFCMFYLALSSAALLGVG